MLLWRTNGVIIGLFMISVIVLWQRNLWQPDILLFMKAWKRIIGGHLLLGMQTTFSNRDLLPAQRVMRKVPRKGFRGRWSTTGSHSRWIAVGPMTRRSASVGSRLERSRGGVSHPRRARGLSRLEVSSCHLGLPININCCIHLFS